jgi:hypothetical protein
LLHGYRAPFFFLQSWSVVAARGVALERLDLVAIGSRVWLSDAAAMGMVEKAECPMWKMNWREMDVVGEVGCCHTGIYTSELTL